MNNFTDIDKYSWSQMGIEVTVEENVCVRKSLVSDGGSRLRFEYAVESDHVIPPGSANTRTTAEQGQCS
jgi:hypothetical protein